ncbi:MAG: hypothetical protein EOM52_02350 [Clostridia bacterium]|nr:hypothetical protein [Clostridia bacterium]
MVANVMIKNREDVENLNKVASQQNFDMSVSCGSVIVDARSLLALFTLIGSKVSLVAPDEVSHKDFSKLIKRMNLVEA